MEPVIQILQAEQKDYNLLKQELQQFNQENAGRSLYLAHEI
jgi:hypothetical protein